MKPISTTLTVALTLCLFANTASAGQTHPNQSTSLFMQALQNENYELMETLLQQGADINCKACNRAEKTPLMLAAEKSAMTHDKEPSKLVTFLIDKGANPNLQDKEGMTALDLSLKKGLNPYWSQTKDALYLLDHGANPNIKDKQGNNALHIFAKSAYIPLNGIDNDFRQQKLNQLSAVTYTLLSHGINIDQPNNAGNTPLHLSIAHCSAYASKMLLINGANPNSKNKNGQTPMDIAIQKAAQDRPDGQCMLAVKVLKNEA